MDNFLSQFLFVKNGEKRVSPSKSPKCPRTKKFSTVCDYNILPDDKKQLPIVPFLAVKIYSPSNKYSSV